ncbi:tRNA (adenosine(37)-N6)-threonylcarbamoyltransferase complex dimerization subunit type 1 TsaB [Thioalkalicoccus limnaeus]|uniref:tRNA threonylcarbamoyladenosine biosynthesis protein TsaB n=1 Tax=Thioalkalicoccus limnaeus TaxID=120681 RepID=A0ABV4BIW8_9GAMM
MKLLAFETSGEACSVALRIGSETRQRIELAPRRHGELVLAMADGLLAEAGLRLRELDALAFGRGPGSFTGVRIAAAVVQGAAFGAELPVVPVSTLAALAQGAYRTDRVRFSLVALDARMGQVYWGRYRIDPQGFARLEGDEAVANPGEVSLPATGRWFGVGSGWSVHGATLSEHAAAWLEAIMPNRPCEAQDVADLASALFAEGAQVRPEAAVPVYLRDQVTFVRPNSGASAAI